MSTLAKSSTAALLLLLAYTPSHSQGLGGLLSGLQNAMVVKPAQASNGAGVPSQGSKSFGGRATENYCRNLFSIAAIGGNTPINEALISEEFRLDPSDFFDALITALAPNGGQSSYAFPAPEFYRGEFETDKINVLYGLLLSYPSAQYMAALIAEARKAPDTPQYDHQARNDAIAALAIIQYRLKDKSISPSRWQDLIGKLEKEEHYTGQVIRARLLASGEGGQRDPRRAVSLAREANDLRNLYSREGGYRSMSSRNYTVRSNQTMFEVLTANPGLPNAQYFEQFMKKYAAFKNNPNPAPELEAQLGPALKRINRAASSARTKAEGLLTEAVGVSKKSAQKASLDSATRNRVSDKPDVNSDARAMAAIARQLESVTQFNDTQKVVFSSALADAHESGDQAVAMMPTMMMAVMNLMSQRGMESLPAILPYSQAFQNYSDNACAVITRWDHVAEVTRTPTKPAAAAGNAMSDALGVK